MRTGSGWSDTRFLQLYQGSSQLPAAALSSCCHFPEDAVLSPGMLVFSNFTHVKKNLISTKWIFIFSFEKFEVCKAEVGIKMKNYKQSAQM